MTLEGKVLEMSLGLKKKGSAMSRPTPVIVLLFKGECWGGCHTAAAENSQKCSNHPPPVQTSHLLLKFLLTWQDLTRRSWCCERKEAELWSVWGEEAQRRIQNLEVLLKAMLDTLETGGWWTCRSWRCWPSQCCERRNNGRCLVKAGWGRCPLCPALASL